MSVRQVIPYLAVLALVGSAGAANAACYAPQQQLPASDVRSFLDNPNGLLSQNPNGGGEMISRVRDLAASDPATLSAVMGLLATANTSQQSAIGSGLGQAYRVCIRPDQTFATQIQQAMVGATSQNAKDSFAAVNPDSQIGAVGGGGAGAGGAGGAGGGGAGAGTGGGGTGVGGPTTGIATVSGGSSTTAFGNNATTNPGSVSLTGGTGGGVGGLSSSGTSVFDVSPGL